MKSSNPSKPRVVPSRYKQAATEASKKMVVNNNSNPSTSGSSFENSRIRVQKPGHAGSINNLTQMESSFCFNKHAKVRKSNPKLHSTAVNSTFFDKTQLGSTEIFSTTVVGNHAKPSNVTLADLPNISEICPASVIKKPNDKGRNSPIVEEFDDLSERDYSMDELRAEYLQYLTWALIDVRSKNAFEKQVSEAKKQISSLTQLIEEEDEKLFEEKQKVQLLKHYENVCQNHQTLKEEITKLNETVEPCSNALNSLSHHLEDKINQIKLEDIFIPSDEEAYKECLHEALQDNCVSVNTLNSDLKDRTSQLQMISRVVQDINEEIDFIEPCLMESDKAASLVVQESSLKFSVNSPRKNHSDLLQ